MKARPLVPTDTRRIDHAIDREDHSNGPQCRQHLDRLPGGGGVEHLCGDGGVGSRSEDQAQWHPTLGVETGDDLEPQHQEHHREQPTEVAEPLGEPKSLIADKRQAQPTSHHQVGVDQIAGFIRAGEEEKKGYECDERPHPLQGVRQTAALEHQPGVVGSIMGRSGSRPQTHPKGEAKDQNLGNQPPLLVPGKCSLHEQRQVDLNRFPLTVDEEELECSICQVSGRWQKNDGDQPGPPVAEEVLFHLLDPGLSMNRGRCGGHLDTNWRRRLTMFKIREMIRENAR